MSIEDANPVVLSEPPDKSFTAITIHPHVKNESLENSKKSTFMDNERSLNPPIEPSSISTPSTSSNVSSVSTPSKPQFTVQDTSIDILHTSSKASNEIKNSTPDPLFDSTSSSSSDSASEFHFQSRRPGLKFREPLPSQIPNSNSSSFRQRVQIPHVPHLHRNRHIKGIDYSKMSHYGSIDQKSNYNSRSLASITSSSSTLNTNINFTRNEKKKSDRRKDTRLIRSKSSGIPSSVINDSGQRGNPNGDENSAGRIRFHETRRAVSSGTGILRHSPNVYSARNTFVNQITIGTKYDDADDEGSHDSNHSANIHQTQGHPDEGDDGEEEDDEDERALLTESLLSRGRDFDRTRAARDSLRLRERDDAARDRRDRLVLGCSISIVFLIVFIIIVSGITAMVTDSQFPQLEISTSWPNGGRIPLKYGCFASPSGPSSAVSFPLKWRNIPPSATNLVILFASAGSMLEQTYNDPVHWLVTDIPLNAGNTEDGVDFVGELPENASRDSSLMPGAAEQHPNLFSTDGFYWPPCSNQNDSSLFIIHAYAIDAPASIDSYNDAREVMNRFVGLPVAKLTGTYGDVPGEEETTVEATDLGK